MSCGLAHLSSIKGPKEVTTCDDKENLRSLSLELFDVMEDVGASIVWLIYLQFKVLMK